MTVELNYKAVKRSFRTIGSSIGAALVGFIQSGTGAVRRNMQDKLREVALSVTDKGAVGDDSTNNQDDIESALTDGRAVIFPPGTFRTSGGFVVNTPVPAILGNSDAEIVQTGVSGGSPLFYIGNATPNGTSHPDYPGTVATFSGALTNTTKTVTVSSVAGFSEGDDVMLLLGQDPNDPDQHFIRMWNVIEDITGTDVTFRIPILEAVSGTFAAGEVSAHRMFKPTAIVENMVLADMKISQSGDAAYDYALFLNRTRHVNVRNLTFPEVRSAIVIAESEGVEASNLYIRRARYVSGGGAGVGIYGSRNVAVRGVTMLEVDHTPVYIENQCRQILLEDFIIQCGPDKTTGPIISITGGCRGVTMRRFTLHKQSVGAVIALSAVGDSEYRTEDFRLLGSINEFPLRHHFGFIEYKGTRYGTIKRFSRRIALVPNMSNLTYELPDGLYKRIKMRVASKTGITFVALNNATYTNLPVVSTADTLDRLPAAGTLGDLTTEIFTKLGADFTFNEDAAGKYINVYTDGTLTDNNYLEIEAEVFITDDDGVGGAIQSGRLVGSATWSPGAIADGAFVTTDFTVTGARPGDPVQVGFTGLNSTALTDRKMELTAYVWTSNTVTVVLKNSTGASQTPASGLLRAVVSQE